MKKAPAKVNYRETQLWIDAKALALEVYRLSANWPQEGQELATEIRGLARTVVRSVPNAFKKPGISGNFYLQLSRGSFAELEALLEIAVELGFLEPTASGKVQELAKPIEAKFSELAAEAKKHAKEMMHKRTSLFGGGGFDDDDDDF
ncbi:MAG: hypothetical protein HONBIEJF_02949 [Fimbriimonadaceae bacterium]|nr:hypothetical protein [Fimbriimonadaceae bacterium]